MHTYLHPHSLSPDPLYGRTGRRISDRRRGLTLYPHRVAWTNARAALPTAWLQRLNLFENPGPVTLKPTRADVLTDMVFDFGTEVEGQCEVTLRTVEGGNVFAYFGESLCEARELGLHSRCEGHQPRKQHWNIAGAGNHTRRFERGGFRYVRLYFVDFKRPLTLRRIAVEAEFTFDKRRGDLQCSDRLFQRVWQSSVYTARLCTLPDTLWDGIKRDRVGWYGDARITSLANDLVWFDPLPAQQMLLQLPLDAWANHIPNYSFDALAMLKRQILAYGVAVPDMRAVYQRAQAFMRWVITTQTAPNGMLTRRDNVRYFFGIGFLDWSPQPIGGRFEELGWLQCAWLEALQDGAQIARWLGDATRAADWSRRARHLGTLISKRFWEPGCGFQHTLNVLDSTAPWKMPHAPEMHYRGTYLEKRRGGPSGPSRHSNIRAVLAGLADAAQRKVILKQGCGNPRLPQIITSYYKYYEGEARARCGDAAGALLNLRDYFGRMLADNDSATIWESYEPAVHDFNRWALGTWPKSLCHGWGAGTVPVTANWLLGVEPVAPGYSAVLVRQPPALPWTFRATIPTPFGLIEVERERRGAPAMQRVPRGIKVVENTR